MAASVGDRAVGGPRRVRRAGPIRNAPRQPRSKGGVLAALVPFGQLLYVFRLKDEGIMFYYGRPVVRLSSPQALPASHGPCYCILAEREWLEWSGPRRAQLVQRMVDEQGAPIFLVRVL